VKLQPVGREDEDEVVEVKKGEEVTAKRLKEEPVKKGQ
jgi:hypothetical protein